jgi:branched-chain amino acid transport system substrate-binding protein
MQRLRTLIVCFGLTLFTIASAPSSFDEAIVIGQSAPLSGPNAAFGKDVRTGAMAYFRGVNARGGINGRMVELRSLDDGNDARRSDENTRALLGDCGATLSTPAVSQAQRAGVAFVAPFTGAEHMRQSSEVIFNIRASYTDEIKELVRVLGARQKLVGVVHYDDDVGKDNLATAEKSLSGNGDTKIVSIPMTRGQENVPAVAAQISKSELSVVLLTVLPSPGVEVVKAVRMAKKNIPLFGAISFTSPSHLSRALTSTISETGSYGVAVTSVVPNHRLSAIPVALEYQTAMERFFPTEPHSLTSFESFLAAKMLVVGMRRTNNVTRRSLLDTLSKISELDLGGYTVRWPQNNRYGSTYVELLSIRGPDKFIIM